MKSVFQQISDRCRHFTGVSLNSHCAVGVAYEEIKDDSQKGRYRWPCLASDKATTICARRQLPTLEEVAQQEQEINDAVRAHQDNLAAGLCPICFEDVEPRKQIGPCIYGACGHRLGQGQL